MADCLLILNVSLLLYIVWTNKNLHFIWNNEYSERGEREMGGGDFAFSVKVQNPTIAVSDNLNTVTLTLDL